MDMPFRRFGWPLALPLALIATTGAAALLPLRDAGGTPPFQPQTVTVPAAAFQHRLAGEYSRDGLPVRGPLVEIRSSGFEIMTYQVSVADYAVCVAEGVCKGLDNVSAPGTLPVTGVSYADATSYAEWLSHKTGANWRLPDSHEWVHAAGSRFVEDQGAPDSDDPNPARRWLANYEREAELKSGRAQKPQPAGSFGANERGVHDIAGNVWEWTRTCLTRVTLNAAGMPVTEAKTCGIYVVEGQHRAMMSFFIRNPKSGGCSVGAPPDHLGFRLVKEPRWHEWILVRTRQRLRLA